MECTEGVSGDTFFSVFRNFRPHRSHFQLLCALYRSEVATPAKKIRTPENAIKLVCSTILKKVIRQTPVMGNSAAKVIVSLDNFAKNDISLLPRHPLSAQIAYNGLSKNPVTIT